MRKAYILFIFMLGGAIFYSNSLLKEFSTNMHSWATGYEIMEMAGKELWVEVHDVSPAYLSKLDEVVQVLERHPDAYSKAVLFIIPNHGGVTPMHEYPEFIARLRTLEDAGYILGLHGYAHDKPLKKPEFKTSYEEAEALLMASKEEFAASDLGFPTHFLPPGWRTTREADTLLHENFDYVYYYYYIVSPNGIIPSQSLEYVWHDYNYRARDRARRDYRKGEGVIRLTLHLGAINNEAGLRFLEEYLSSIEEKE
jgi:hypothetical protein